MSIFKKTFVINRLTVVLSATGKLANSNGRFRGIIRASSYSVASVVSLLMVSAVVPPLVADQSDRAVVNAPVALLTAQVPGDIDTIAVQPGEAVSAGQVIASISNKRIDRSTLIVLEGKATDSREHALAAERMQNSNRQYLAVLDKTIADQSDQIAEILGQQIVELKSQQAASASAVQEKKAILDRQKAMVARKVASSEMLGPTQQQYAAALHQMDAETAKLSQKQTQLDGLKKGVFIGDELGGLSSLAQKRHDLDFETQKIAIGRAELEATFADQQKLLDAERDRLKSLAAATVAAPAQGRILNIEAATGRHVGAGDTIASLVDCDKIVVVAIFSYRQAQALGVGSRVEITGSSLLSGRNGTVSAILPKAGDKIDDQYAVPFPETERREMYVLVAPDKERAGSSVEAAEQAVGGPACDVGRWVTVSRVNGWMPSTSVVWRTISEKVTDLITAPFAPASAATTHHFGAPAKSAL